MNFFNVSLVAFLAIIASSSAIPHHHLTDADFDHCQKICPDIYLPVCGYNGKVHKLFASECLFDVENCFQQVKHDYVYMITALYMCDDQNHPAAMNEEKKSNCAKICTLEYNPVCGTDGQHAQTFGNMCAFEVANCESNYKLMITRKGECPEEKSTPAKKEIKKDCLKACTMEYDPVCGSDGQHAKTFGNKCTFEVANCESNYRMMITRMGECPEEKATPAKKENKKDCLKACTFEYNPVCGTDGQHAQTYGNMCSFEVANCESNFRMMITRMGECPEEKATPVEEKKSNCAKICTLEYNPVCGTDGQHAQTFGNMCAFEVANCESNYKLMITRKGECQDETPKIVEVKKECIRPCPAIYLPVCGFDGEKLHTYGNKCEYDMMNCDSDNHLRMIRTGEC